jgi:hypothetical protein
MSTLGLVLLIAAQAATPSVPPEDPEVLVELQHALARAWVAGDRGTIERVIAPDWTTTGPDGTVRTRAQVLGEVFDTHVHGIQKIIIDAIDVRLFGEAAVVSEHARLGRVAGHRYDVRIRFTDVFVSAGQWQAVASPASLLGDQR